MAGGMASGGWGRRGLGIPLDPGVRTGSAGPAHISADPPSVPSPARHCWVRDAVDGEGVTRPGLLVEWRQTEGGWEGRVVYSARLRAREWGLVEEWLPAARLTPV